MEQKHNFHWLAVLWSALIIAVLPFVLRFLVVLGYGLVVGFESRGDMEVIVEKETALQQSFWFELAFFVLVAALIIWRMYVLSKKVTGRVELHLLATAGLGVLGRVGLLALMGGGALALSLLLAVELLIYALVTYAGLRLFRRGQAVTQLSA